MRLAAGLIALALSCGSALAQVAIYGQCGGQGWTGGTTCVSGCTCVYSNPYYSQCLPSTSSSTTTSKPTSTTTPPPASTGFIKTSGTKFTLNGSKYTVVGSNAYWVGLSGYSTSEMHQAFSDIANAGGTTVRTWGFNEVTNTNGYADYYQSWSGSTPSINYGSNGLGNFDNVVAAAKANGIHLIVTLTNNWSAYGGMDVYTKQILNSANHDLFYTNTQVINAYKNYVKAFVGRYVNEPTIMGWELANEPQCTGDTNQSTGTCTVATITNWVKDLSAYIKSIDHNHLVAIGDCGFYNRAGGSGVYYANDGIDFDNQFPISTLDFGTVHLYPASWGVSGDQTSWGTQWIADHVKNQNSVGKPVILEEFGIPTNQPAVYTTWLNEVVSSGLAGDLIWQAGSHFSSGSTANDGLAVYPDGPVYPVLQSHAKAMKARS